MIIRKNRVYKVYHHCNNFEKPFPRKYLLICPSNSLTIADDYLKGFDYDSSRYPLNCKFIVCFDGCILFDTKTDIARRCSFEELNNNDFEDIKKAMDLSRGKYKYNRRKNEIVEV